MSCVSAGLDRSLSISTPCYTSICVLKPKRRRTSATGYVDSFGKYVPLMRLSSLGARGQTGAEKVKGAFETESSLSAFVLNHAPKPVTWGTYVSVTDIHFYLYESVEMDDHVHLPTPGTTAVSELHLSQRHEQIAHRVVQLSDHNTR
ncbi:hypothetical protein B0J18DRAFT_238493 [Chaetomium sp. MPI-SDFR-AT-0129]|nr:hypothetical protein B0J18DRAFT_238493 [Chaetomium sp. MPI-SDFR-AT-0129]